MSNDDNESHDKTSTLNDDSKEKALHICTYQILIPQVNTPEGLLNTANQTISQLTSRQQLINQF
jgi:hypothetical protein